MSEPSVTGDVYMRVAEGLRELLREGYPVRNIRILVSEQVWNDLIAEAGVEMPYGPLSPSLDGARAFAGLPIDSDPHLADDGVLLRYEVVV